MIEKIMQGLFVALVGFATLFAALTAFFFIVLFFHMMFEIFGPISLIIMVFFLFSYKIGKIILESEND